jgi:hypothetical protein
MTKLQQWITILRSTLRHIFREFRAAATDSPNALPDVIKAIQLRSEATMAGLIAVLAGTTASPVASLPHRRQAIVKFFNKKDGRILLDRDRSCVRTTASIKYVSKLTQIMTANGNVPSRYRHAKMRQSA